jgi:hypothetical protein
VTGEDHFDPSSRLKSATKRAKSDVANKLVSMFLHLLSQKLSEAWGLKISDKAYLDDVRRVFSDCCPYCSASLNRSNVIVEHPDGMNRLRAGLHVPGNVLLACRRCNGEKRRDDSLATLKLANSGWESFLSHDGRRCTPSCFTCTYWRSVWPNDEEREVRLQHAAAKIRSFRAEYPHFERTHPLFQKQLPKSLAVLYTDCQTFAGTRISTLMNEFLRDFPVV